VEPSSASFYSTRESWRANFTGFRVTTMRDIGKGDCYGIPIGYTSSAADFLSNMQPMAVIEMIQEMIRNMHRFHCV
jgi:hypothetical protein